MNIDPAQVVSLLVRLETALGAYEQRIEQLEALLAEHAQPQKEAVNAADSQHHDQ